MSFAVLKNLNFVAHRRFIVEVLFHCAIRAFREVRRGGVVGRHCRRWCWRRGQNWNRSLPTAGSARRVRREEEKVWKRLRGLKSRGRVALRNRWRRGDGAELVGRSAVDDRCSGGLRGEVQLVHQVVRASLYSLVQGSDSCNGVSQSVYMLTLTLIRRPVTRTNVDLGLRAYCVNES